MQKSVELVSYFNKNEISYDPISVQSGKAELSSVIKSPFSNTMGAGFIKLSSTSFDWQVKYDEVICVTSGSMYIVENEQKITANKGDIYFLKEGAKVTYGTDQDVEFFYSLYPANWRELNGLI